ncbi:MAG: PaaI family thioesterase [Rhodobacteraceae bacterium]|nr:PaaI family thioesterase [Paracoccaceae bacterium]
MTTDSNIERARNFFRLVPHSMALQMRLDSIGSGQAELSMPYSPDLIGDPETGILHGGAVSALLDSCAGVAVFSHPEVRQGTATLTLTINYMRPAQPGLRIFARAECFHVTRYVAFARVTATDSENGPLVATATGAFTVG